MNELKNKSSNLEIENKILEDLVEVEDKELIKKESLKKTKENEDLKNEFKKDLEHSKKLIESLIKIKDKIKKTYNEALIIHKQNKFDVEVNNLNKIRNLGDIFSKQRKIIITLSVLLAVFFISTFSMIGPASKNNIDEDYYKTQLATIEEENTNLKNERESLENTITTLKNQVKKLEEENNELKTVETTSTEITEKESIENVELDPYIKNLSNVINEYKLLINHIETYGDISNPEEKISFENTFLDELVKIDTKLKSINISEKYSTEHGFFLEKSWQMIQFITMKIEYLKNQDLSNADIMMQNFYSTYHDFVAYYEKLKS